MDKVLSNDFVELVILLLAFAVLAVSILAATWIAGLKIIDTIFGKVEE